MAEKSAFAYGNGDGTVPLHSADLYDPTRGFNYTGGAPDGGGVLTPQMGPPL